MLSQICSTAGNGQNGSKITSALTVYGDVFAAGCVFFYFLSRGLHPFGNLKDITENVAKYQPVNLKSIFDHLFVWNFFFINPFYDWSELDINHFAYQSIKDMIGEPPQNGTQYLRIAAAHFKDVPPCKFHTFYQCTVVYKVILTLEVKVDLFRNISKNISFDVFSYVCLYILWR
jgi:hypothetical protein